MPHWPIPPWNKKAQSSSKALQVLELLGNPHLKLPPVIHIAGTNGKGSSCAMLKAIFEATGKKVHVYTSPHLLEFNERIVLRGEKISDQYLCEIAERTRIASEKLEAVVSFFDATTIMAFLAFSEIPADILILETGMGGRLDMTNIVPNPILTLITTISYDHMEYLGNTLELIAQEKAGIIKPNVPCVINFQNNEVYDVLLSQADNIGAPAFCYSYDFYIEKSQNGMRYISNNIDVELPLPALRGDHQIINGAGVIASITLLNNFFGTTKENIISGLQNVYWPARIQKIDMKRCSHILPKDSDIQIWLDGAHNQAGATVLSNWIKEDLKSKVYLIIGMTKNRDISAFCANFKDLIISGYTVQVLSEPLSYNADTLASIAINEGINLEASYSLCDAIEKISEQAKHSSANVVICGSLFLAADFMKLCSNTSSS